MSVDSEDSKVFDKNQKDLQKVEILQDENEELKELFDIGEKIYDNDHVTPDEREKFLSSGCTSLDELEAKIHNN